MLVLLLFFYFSIHLLFSLSCLYPLGRRYYSGVGGMHNAQSTDECIASTIRQ